MQRPHTTEPGEGATLRRGRVVVIGVGGLGSAAALGLADAGVGTIGLVDGDRVELSNLQRQTIYTDAVVGQAKVEAAAGALRQRRPDLEVRTFPRHLDEQTLPSLFAEYDFAIDATDGAAAKFMINDGAVATGTPFSHAGAVGWLGQTTTILPGESACYRCVFPVIPDEEDLPTCQFAGILGPVVGAIGALQASEAVKFLLGRGDLLADRLMTYDALAARWRVVPLYRNERCPVCGSKARKSERWRTP